MMSNLSERVTRPLFEEPGPELERDDEWGWPRGFLVGGWANYDHEELGVQYYEAAYLLTEAIRKSEWEDFRVAFPVLYLYRHSIELLLKAAVTPPKKHHNLETLVEEFTLLVQREFNEEVPRWFVDYLREVGGADPSSTAFRYSENFDQSVKMHVSLPGETHVDLMHLRDVMKAIHDSLLRVIHALGERQPRTMP